MQVNFYLKYVNRYHEPSDRSIDGHIKSITKEHICGLQMKSDSLPNVGDRIILKGEPYTITEKIFVPDSWTGAEVLYEVVGYTGRRVHRYGSDSWIEQIPLVTSIK